MTNPEFISYAQDHGVTLSESQGQLLLTYMAEILEINQYMNLTAIREEEAFIDKHLVDSLVCDLSALPQGAKVIDIGTGGGFPGVPLAIKYPELHFVLLDSTAKKLKALDEICQNMGIANVSFITGRAEEISQKKGQRESYDAVVSRGVADYAILSELCLPFLKDGGSFYSWKAKRYQEEIDRAKNALTTLNSEIADINQHLLLKSDEVHVIIQCRKSGSIPKEYPRAFATIKKKPL